MNRSRTALLAALTLGSALLSHAWLAAPAARAAEGDRVCPTQDFWIGEGWGADRGRRSHMGIDLGGKRGTPIYAIEDGVIDRTKLQSNGALQIVMRGESGSKFYYGHMDKVLIKGGQRVRAGDVIGLMGDTGSPGAVHLHFEYWRSGGESAAVDPQDLISTVCRVRKDGTGDPLPSAESNPGSQQDAPKQDAPKQDAPKQDAPKQKSPKPVDDDVAGEVFTNR